MVRGTNRTNRAAPGAARRTAPGAPRRGMVAVIAMLYMLLLVTLALAVYTVANINVQTSENFADVSRAHAAAESTLRWMGYRFKVMNRPTTDQGIVTVTLAKNTLWPALNTAIRNDLATVKGVTLLPAETERVRATGVCIDASSGAKADVTVALLKPVAGTDIDEKWVRVTCTGRYHNAVRSVSMDFVMEKRAKFAVVGKVPIQVGRNTIIDGPIGMSNPNKFPPIYTLSDFMHFDATLKARVQAFQTYLSGVGVVDGKTVANHDGYDGRINVNNVNEFKLAAAAGYSDVSEDGYIDEYDLFLARFDVNKDRAVSKAEFTNPSTGLLYDEELFYVIDHLAPPQPKEDRNNNGVLDTGEDVNGNGKLDPAETKRAGYEDNFISNADGYAKVRGQVSLATTAEAWEANLAPKGQDIYDMIKGPIASGDPTEPGVRFGVTGQDMLDPSPATFEQTTLLYKAMTGPQPGKTTVKNTTTLPYTIAYKVLAAADANGGKVTPTTPVNENTPYGSASWQATYARPVFRNIKFVNVQIPKGLNALFDGCTFEGVTFVDTTHDITKPSSTVITTSKDDGMTWAKRMISGTFSANTALTSANSRGFNEGNNLRFNDCTFNGPLVGGNATAYTHFANSWEFTGATKFDNLVDPAATIVAPQTNIEMGSYNAPSAAPSTLVGMVVAGNIDIRGATVIDGSIVVTGDGAGNTTLAYFGNNDGETDPGEMGAGQKYGRLTLRYNRNRIVPNGLVLPIDITPRVSSYREGTLLP